MMMMMIIIIIMMIIIIITIYYYYFFELHRIVENGKETVEEWEDNILKRRLVDGTPQLTE